MSEDADRADLARRRADELANVAGQPVGGRRGERVELADDRLAALPRAAQLGRELGQAVDRAAGESVSNTTAATLLSASAARSASRNCSMLVPPLTSLIMLTRWLISPYSRMTTTTAG